MSIASRLSRKRGIALVDLIMFIVIVGIALAGMVAAINLGTRNSADPLIEKQALAIAEALLEEVELMPFTKCTAGQSLNTTTDPATCVANTTKERGSSTNPLDNVLDYNGIPALTSSSSDLGGVVTVPSGYSATVAVATDTAVGAGTSTVPAADMAHITVTVNYPGGGSLVLEGYRSRYAPDENS
jgi:MSHA pilin protein MshD